MPKPSATHDVIVVGAGIAGLTAAIALQKAGREVLAFDRRHTAGGLCGTRIMDGYEFAVGCNDFGSGFERELKKLGVNIEFEQMQSRLHCARETYVLPPTAATWVKFVRHAPDMLRIIRALRSEKTEEKYPDLGALLDRCVRSSSLADFFGVTSYAFGRAPQEFRIDLYKANFSQQYGYGYDRLRVPIGGPKVLIDRMTGRLFELGGQIQLGTTVRQVENRNGIKTVRTNRGDYFANYVVSSESRLDIYPADAKPSLYVGVIHLATTNDFRFPAKVHTFAYMPENVRGWLTDLENGKQPSKFGFHIFPCLHGQQREYQTFNVYFLMPRGIHDYSKDEADRLENYMLDQLDKMLPGLRSSLLHKRFVSAKEYTELHRLSSRAAPAVTKIGFQKPDGYDPERDIYYVGNTVHPPGEHAGGALLSGIYAANAICKVAAVRESNQAAA